MQLTIQANAKVNITLDVLRKREDGYHEVEMIMQAIDLADTLHLTPQREGITLVTNHPGLPCDTGNLAYRAAALLQETCQVKTGVHIALEKNIPMAAGLAGGSTDAAGVLLGLNRLWQLNLSLAELDELGAKLGSDVPFCLHGGTMLATGRGERLTALPALPQCYIVLAKPPVGVSTAWVYGQYQQTIAVQHPDTAGTIACLKSGNLEGVAERLCNVLESVTIPAHPEIGQLKDWMLQFGAMASLMSGSGPTVFGLVETREKAIEIADRLRSLSAADIFVAKTVAKVGGEHGTATLAD